MSAYGQATVVVEAGERSGARIQARQATEHGRPLILTEAVVESTTWGREFAESVGDIHVVQGIEQLLEVVHEVLNRRDSLNRLAESFR